MSQQRKYKRSEIIDDDHETRILSSLIELAFESNSKGWEVNKDNSSVQTKPHPTTKRPIYRGIVKNKSNTTMQQVYEYYKGGYKEEDSTIIYHIDDDHHVWYRYNANNSSVISDRDEQYMVTRFKITNYKSLSGVEYNIVGFFQYDICKTHPLYRRPPKKCIRAKGECAGYIYYQRVNAADNDFMCARIQFPVQFGGWVPNWFEHLGQSARVKKWIDGFEEWCKSAIPNILQERKDKGYKQMESILIKDNNESKNNKEIEEEWINIYQELIKLGFEENASIKIAKLYPNNLNVAIDAITKEQQSIEKKQNENNNDIIHNKQAANSNQSDSNLKQPNIIDNNEEYIMDHRHVLDTNKGNEQMNKLKNIPTPKYETKQDEILNEHPNVIDTNKGNNNNLSTIYKQLIEMGFDEQKAKMGAKLAPDDIMEAITIASQVINNNNNINENEKKINVLPEQSIKNQFLKFLKLNRLETYFNKFEETDSSDLEFVGMFDDDFLLNDIGISNKFLRKRFLVKCKETKQDIDKFQNEYGISKLLYDRLAKYGIITIGILCGEVKNKSDLKYKYEITNENQSNFLWNLIQKFENQNEVQFEGS